MRTLGAFTNNSSQNVIFLVIFKVANEVLLGKGQTESKYGPAGGPKKCKARIYHFSIKGALLYISPLGLHLVIAYFQINVIIQQVLNFQLLG